MAFVYDGAKYNAECDSGRELGTSYECEPEYDRKHEMCDRSIKMGLWDMLGGNVGT
jgi:hypothetical protein